MGKDSPWRYSGLNHVREPRPPDIRQPITHSVAFPAYMNPFGCAFPGDAGIPFTGNNGNGNTGTPFTGLALHEYLQPNPPPFRAFDASGHASITAAQKRFLVFDQSGDRTNLVYTSLGNPLPTGAPLRRPNAELPLSYWTHVSDGQGGEEMHEDTEEIDALLYSDSEDDLQEEEASTGHSPFETTTAVSAENDVLDATSVLRCKRKRADAGMDDASLADTASSAGLTAFTSRPSHCHYDGDAESTCVGGGEEAGTDDAGEGEDSDACSGRDHTNKRLKRERIQEMVNVLRRIIPGSNRKGKDASMVLDEAILYLSSLKLKAKTVGAASIL